MTCTVITYLHYLYGFERSSGYKILGPLYTMTMACFHDIARAPETHLNTVLWDIEIENCVVMGSQVQCEDICDWDLN